MASLQMLVTVTMAQVILRLWEWKSPRLLCTLRKAQQVSWGVLESSWSTRNAMSPRKGCTFIFPPFSVEVCWKQVGLRAKAVMDFWAQQLELSVGMFSEVGLLQDALSLLWQHFFLIVNLHKQVPASVTQNNLSGCYYTTSDLSKICSFLQVKLTRLE